MSLTPAAAAPQGQTNASSAAPFASPNLYQLAGGDIQVTFRTSGLRAPFFTYQDSQRSLSFSGEEIRRVDMPDLGTVVSVTLMLTADSGSTTFSVLLPQVYPQGETSVPVHTLGIRTVHQVSIAPQSDVGQRDFYKPSFLSGNASLAVVTL